MTSRQILLPALTVCLSTNPVWGRLAADPLGVWLDESGRAGSAIGPCSSELCGTITWMKRPLDTQGKPKRDLHNAVPALRTRPICGLQMLSGFTAAGDRDWAGGAIYDPQGGKTYSATLRLQPDGTLHVRGYIGIPLFGRSETWTPPTAALPLCGAP